MGSHPGEEVSRVLAPADPNNPDADAWIIVSLSRPKGSTDPVWRPTAAYGPVPLETAEKFLADLGVETAELVNLSACPDVDDLLRQ